MELYPCSPYIPSRRAAGITLIVHCIEWDGFAITEVVINKTPHPLEGYAMAHLVEVLRYKPEVRGFNS